LGDGRSGLSGTTSAFSSITTAGASGAIISVTLPGTAARPEK